MLLTFDLEPCLVLNRLSTNICGMNKQLSWTPPCNAGCSWANYCFWDARGRDRGEDKNAIRIGIKSHYTRMSTLFMTKAATSTCFICLGSFHKAWLLAKRWYGLNGYPVLLISRHPRSWGMRTSPPMSHGSLHILPLLIELWFQLVGRVKAQPDQRVGLQNQPMRTEDCIVQTYTNFYSIFNCSSNGVGCPVFYLAILIITEH